MVSATFRFYGQLNDFLAPARRGRAFDSACARRASIKHMVEALGVPHTEVELVLRNGEPATLSHILQERDRIALYPTFAAFDVGGLLPARAPPLPIMRFVADAHLGGLARMLRMAGFDTLYDNQIEDSAIEALALREARVVLTRDRELLKRRGIGRGGYVRALKPEQQLREVFDRFELASGARPFTLCLHCNAPLRAIGKAAVAGLLPPGVRAQQQDFTTCEVCHRVFWKGSHWKRMCAVLAANTP